MGHRTKIQLFKEAMKFSAAHFTIFSAKERENLHGHNFTIQVALSGQTDANGMLGDYGGYQLELTQMCTAWNETLLLPTRSPHLELGHDAQGRVTARFADEVLVFLPRDVTLLPVANTTNEELARLFG